MWLPVLLLQLLLLQLTLPASAAAQPAACLDLNQTGIIGSDKPGANHSSGQARFVDLSSFGVPCFSLGSPGALQPSTVIHGEVVVSGGPAPGAAAYLDAGFLIQSVYVKIGRSWLPGRQAYCSRGQGRALHTLPPSLPPYVTLPRHAPPSATCHPACYAPRATLPAPPCQFPRLPMRPSPHPPPPCHTPAPNPTHTDTSCHLTCLTPLHVTMACPTGTHLHFINTTFVNVLLGGPTTPAWALLPVVFGGASADPSMTSGTLSFTGCSFVVPCQQLDDYVAVAAQLTADSDWTLLVMPAATATDGVDTQVRFMFSGASGCIDMHVM